MDQEAVAHVTVLEHDSGTPVRWHVLGATFLSYLYDSYDLLVLAITMPVLLKVLGITLAEGGLLASSTMVGAALGSILIGVIAENRGLKFAIMLSLVAFGIGTGLIYVVHTWAEWMVLRFLTGIAIGGIWGPSIALLAQHWAPKYLARASAFMLSTFALGAIAAAFVGRLVMVTDWRLTFLIGSTSAFVAIYVWFVIPADNPLAMKTKAKSAEKKIGLRDILVGDAGKRLAMATLLNVFIMGGYWGAATWIPTFLVKERDVSLVMMTNFSMFMYVAMFFGYQFFGYLGDRIGRKKAMAVALSVCVVSIPVYIIVHNNIFLFWWGTVVGFGYGGPFGLCGALFAELFADNIRALAGGFCWNVGRIGAVLAPFTIGVLGKMYGLQVALVIASCVSLLGLFVLLFLPKALKDSESR